MAATNRVPRIVRWLAVGLKWSLYPIGLYFGILLIGLIPINNDFRPPDDEQVVIYVASSAVHADLFLPATTETIDWHKEFNNSTFGVDTKNFSHIAIGWGDRGFYLETETWADLKLTTAANALLLPSESCMHVDFTSAKYHKNVVAVAITAAQYRDLVDFIKSSFKRSPNGAYLQIEGYAYSGTDAFFQAHGKYHLLNTCNSWIGRALQAAGVRTPWLTPLPNTPTLYLR